MAAKHHIGDLGTVFECTIKNQDAAVVDVSAATTLQIVFQKPTGIGVAKTAVFVTTGTDGKIKYTTTVASDLDTAGHWRLQGRVTLSATQEWRSDIHEFEVEANLPTS